MVFGHSLSGTIDHLLHLDHGDAGIDHGAGHGSALDLHAGADQPPTDHTGGNFPNGSLWGTFYDWLNAGRVPLLILLMAGLSAFAVSGLVLQTVAMHATPAPLPALLAAAIAFLAVIPTTRFTSRLIAHFLPRDESYAIEEADLVGLTGTVTLGPVEADSAGRAKVEDKFGNTHFPRIRAARADLKIEQGAKILVVDRIGSELTVVPAELRALESANR
jgi:membrane protein implicated in regulation of membrane protease activity